MLKQAIFENLKFGDEVVQMTLPRKYYTYLSRDPGWKDDYCFLSDGMGGAEHFSKHEIETEFFTYDNVQEVEKLNNKYAAQECIRDLIKYGYLTKDGASVLFGKEMVE